MIRKTRLNPARSFLAPLFSVAALSLAAFGASGCSKGLPKLTDDQKAQLSGTIQSAARGPTAANNIGGAAQPATHFPLSANWVAGLVASRGSHDDSEASMEQKLKAAHDGKTCDIVANVPAMSSTNSVDLTNLNAAIKVSGATCPVAMDFEIAVQGSQTNLSGKISGNYAVNDKDFATLNDVNAISLNGTFSVSGSQDSAQLDLNLTGSLVSQKYGNVSYTITASGTGSHSGNQGTVVADFVFPTFEAKAKVEANGDKVSYSINGEDMSESDFTNYFSGLGV